MKKNVFTKAILAATAAVAIACTSPAYAAPDAAPKIGVVSLERVLHDSAPAKAATEKLQKEFARRKADIDKQAADFKARADAFQKNAPAMSQIQRCLLYTS